MTAKEFMSQVRMAESELKLLGARRRHYEDLIMAIGANTSSSVINKPTGASKVETAAVGLVFLTEQIVTKEAEYTAIVTKAEKLIALIPQEKFRTVLTLRYMCGDSWKTIRDKMDYKDEKSALRCHGYALKALQRVM